MASGAKKPKREGKSKQRKNKEQEANQQVDMFALMLQVQTLSLMLDDVRNRLSQIEGRLNIDNVTQADRANLSNLDRAG